jgi:hypothetical protein
MQLRSKHGPHTHLDYLVELEVQQAGLLGQQQLPQSNVQKSTVSY